MQTMFLDIAGIQGESTEEKHANQIELLSLSYGISMPLSHGTGPSNTHAAHGRANFGDITFTKYVDKATNPIAQACAGGDDISKMTFTIYGAAGKEGQMVEYYKITIHHVIITSTSFGAGGGDLPIETVTVYYNEIHCKYEKHDHGGNSPAGVSPFMWDRTLNKGAASE